MTDQSLLSNLQKLYVNTLASSIKTQKIALVDFPNHSNCGDSAIYRGEVRAFDLLRKSVVHRSDARTFSLTALERLPNDVTIVIHGGGNFGDLYPHHQRVRSSILATFPDRPIVQLPQTIHFENPLGTNATEIEHSILKAKNFTLMVRDNLSLDFASSHYDCNTLLVPDGAFALGAQRRYRQPELPLIAVCRTDHEAKSNLFPHSCEQFEIPCVDWTEHPRRWSWANILAKSHVILESANIMGTTVSELERRAGTIYSLSSRRHFNRGLSTVAKGRCVLTDRLHALILALLQGIPVTAVDTGYGKIRSVWETWLSDSTLSSVSNDAEAAIQRALGI